MPLIATVTPGTISVESRSVTNTTNGRVPSVDFARDETLWSDSMGVGYINEASPAVTRLLSAVSSSIGIIPITAPFPNSSFTLQFYAPALKCESLANAKKNGQPVGNCNNCTSLQTLWDDTIDSSFAANYYYWQATKPVYSQNLFFIRAGGGKSVGGDPHNISCQLWNASYTTKFKFNDGVQTTLIQDLAYESTMEFNTSVAFTSLPPGGRAYLAMYLAMSDLLSGEVGIRQGLSSSGMFGSDLPVVKTGLMACPEVLAGWKAFGSREPPLDQLVSPWMCRNNSVAAAVEDMFQNLTLSLLSSEFLNGNTTTDIRVTSPKNFWRYGPLDLLISYVAGVAVAFVALLVGSWALIANGYSADVSFSSILLTTRNPDLDGVAVGQCLGAQPLDRNFEKLKLQLGVVGRTDGIEHAAFGIRGTVKELRKNQECI
ncbi:hypothetical protein DBV05_g10257 [Lasiodiplodia theobromae]|uniref:Uncharacterized protein n=1 Tax=Lasiodiplodia theobromae TaxID=45133 RepID=A0A5N5D0F2_9PEZI|nr:hypothetical protein DBV05_g10257 [Lasiodiplodia theobromae]